MGGPRPSRHEELAAKAWGEPSAHKRGSPLEPPHRGAQKKKGGCWRTIKRCFWRSSEQEPVLEKSDNTPSLATLPEAHGAARAIEQFVPLPNAQLSAQTKEGSSPSPPTSPGGDGSPQPACQEGADTSKASLDASGITLSTTVTPPDRPRPAGAIEIDTIPTAMIFRPMPPVSSAPAPSQTADFDLGSETARGRRHMQELQRVQALLAEREAQLSKEQAADRRPLAEHTLQGFPRMPEGFSAPQRPLVPTLPISKTPNITPQQTPRDLDLSEEDVDPSKDSTRVVGKGGKAVNCALIERMLLQNIDAVQDCMLVSHFTTTEVGCLLTLKSAPGSAGLALDHSGLALASKSGSEASTVISARQCAMFRKGLSLAIERVNHQIAGRTVQIRRFQILRETFSQGNGLLNAQGGLERRRVLHRYRHIIDDMYQYEQRYPHKWILGLEGTSGNEENVTTQKQVQADEGKPAGKPGSMDRSVLDASISPPKLTGLASRPTTLPHSASSLSAKPAQEGTDRPSVNFKPPSPQLTPQKAPASPSVDHSAKTNSLLDQWSPEKILAQWSPVKLIPGHCSPSKSVPAPEEEAPTSWLPLGFAGEWLSALGEIGNPFDPEGSRRGDDGGTKSAEGLPQNRSPGTDTDSLARGPASDCGSRQDSNQSGFASIDGLTPRNGMPNFDVAKAGKRGASPMCRGGRHGTKQRLPPAALHASFKGDNVNGAQNRGAYAPAFASGAVRPFTKEASQGAMPISKGPTGLPIACTTVGPASGSHAQGKSRDGRKRGPCSKKAQLGQTPRPPLVLEQTPTGEWAF
mmetsp:Transcript_5329/g.13492  ORF Transcript_5329/g.13492 Transcript_5329/m.13492 type:complete len:804 (+) Transcript_5329:180-2591(+)